MASTGTILEGTTCPDNDDGNVLHFSSTDADAEPTYVCTKLCKVCSLTAAGTEEFGA
jgi:hypothetical protein